MRQAATGADPEPWLGGRPSSHRPGPWLRGEYMRAHQTFLPGGESLSCADRCSVCLPSPRLLPTTLAKGSGCLVCQHRVPRDATSGQQTPIPGKGSQRHQAPGTCRACRHLSNQNKPSSLSCPCQCLGLAVACVGLGLGPSRLQCMRAERGAAKGPTTDGLVNRCGPSTTEQDSSLKVYEFPAHSATWMDLG